jgi:mono/diheme cytochrome c family protein
MKRAYTISTFVFCAVLMKCASKKQTQYDIPGHVPEVNKKIFIERAEKGKTLYKIHCSGCHGIFTKGKDGVPNFTKIQIDNYQSTALIGLDPNNHAVAKKMSSEQIDYVVTFLRLRKVD